MNETPQQYTQRIMAHAEGKQPMAVQAATAKKLERAIKGVSAGKLRKRPAPDKWSVSEIAAHLADAEVAIGWRLRLILGAPGTPIAAFDQDAPQAARSEAGEDGGRRDLAVLDRQGDLFDACERTGTVPGDDEALHAVVAKRPGAGRQPPIGIDDDADRMRAADPAHGEQGIVRDGGPDPDDDGIHQRAEPVEMVEPFAAIDVVRMPRHRRGAAVERLADLPDHHEIVHQPGAQRPENALPPRRRIAQPGPDGGEKLPLDIGGQWEPRHGEPAFSEQAFSVQQSAEHHAFRSAHYRATDLADC